MRFMIRQFLVTAMVASVLLEARTASGAPTLEVGQMHWEGAVSSGSALQAGLRGSPDHPGRPGVDFCFNFVKDERDVAVPLDLAVGLRQRKAMRGGELRVEQDVSVRRLIDAIASRLVHEPQHREAAVSAGDRHASAWHRTQTGRSGTRERFSSHGCLWRGDQPR